MNLLTNRFKKSKGRCGPIASRNAWKKHIAQKEPVVEVGTIGQL